MAIRKLLLPLTGAGGAGGANGAAALATALLAARHWQAQLAALYVRADSRDVAQMAGESLSAGLIEEMMRAAETESDRREDAMRALFTAGMAEHGVAPAQAGGPGAEMVVVTGREDDRIAYQARLADITVVPSPGRDAEASDALHAVLFDSGRPVLIAPPDPPTELGRNICLAWSGTAESAAAARYAIPWMQQAERVTFLCSREYRRPGPTVEELAEYLALHDVHGSIVPFGPVHREVGAGMLAAAHEAGADMLVMGAYSSSRLRQLILGGVTRYILENADLPVLMCR